MHGKEYANINQTNFVILNSENIILWGCFQNKIIHTCYAQINTLKEVWSPYA